MSIEQVKHIKNCRLWQKKIVWTLLYWTTTKILAKNQSGQAVPHMYDDNDVE